MGGFRILGLRAGGFRVSGRESRSPASEYTESFSTVVMMPLLPEGVTNSVPCPSSVITGGKELILGCEHACTRKNEGRVRSLAGSSFYKKLHEQGRGS